MYLDTLKEHTRIELIYDAVATLKKIENDRPIKPSDIQLKYDAVNARAQAEQDTILEQEKALAKELEDIGDGHYLQPNSDPSPGPRPSALGPRAEPLPLT